MEEIKKLWEAFKGSIEQKYYEIKQGVQNLWYWAPVIWKDRPWGPYYTYSIWERKLQLQIKYFETSKIRFVGQEREVEWMKTALRLLKKVQEEYYEMEYIDYHITSRSLSPLNNGFHSMQSRLIVDELPLYFNLYKNELRRLTNKNPKIKKALHNKDHMYIAIMLSTAVEQKAKKLLFKILEQKIDIWWI